LVKKNLKKKHVAPHLGCHISVDRVKIGLGGPKLPQMQNIGGSFVVFFS